MCVRVFGQFAEGGHKFSLSFCNNIKFCINLDWHKLSYGDCHSSPCPADAQLSVFIDPSKTVRVTRGHRPPEGWLSQINPTTLANKQRNETKCEWKMCQKPHRFVILCCCSRRLSFPSLSLDLQPPLLLSHFYFYRQVTCNWLERGRRGEQMEREQRERGWKRESRTHEIPLAQWEPLALPAFWFSKNKRGTSPKEGQQDFHIASVFCPSGSPPFCLGRSGHGCTLNIKITPSSLPSLYTLLPLLT